MQEDLKIFMLSDKPMKESSRTSKLDPYLEDIKVLRQNGYGYGQIKQYLGEYKKISISRKGVSDFIKKKVEI